MYCMQWIHRLACIEYANVLVIATGLELGIQHEYNIYTPSNGYTMFLMRVGLNGCDATFKPGELCWLGARVDMIPLTSVCY